MTDSIDCGLEDDCECPSADYHDGYLAGLHDGAML